MSDIRLQFANEQLQAQLNKANAIIKQQEAVINTLHAQIERMKAKPKRKGKR